MTTRRRAASRVRLVLGAVALLGLLAGGWLWLRDSTLVAVRTVEISGVSGPDGGQIRSALTLAARNMTTLDVRIGPLRTVVAPYPVVKDLRVSTQFPHGMRIRVIEQLPVGAVSSGGRAIAASADGTLLRDVPTSTLPMIPVVSLPGGSQVTDGSALAALALLGAAPSRLVGRISEVSSDPTHGLVVALRSGPSIYFGDRSELAAKWVAATAVLTDPSSAGASYIDVTDPARPAAGVGQQAVVAAGLATTGSTSGAAGTTLGASGATAPATGTAASGTAVTNPPGTGTSATGASTANAQPSPALSPSGGG